MNQFRFPAASRLKTPRDFDRVYATGIYAADDVLVINAAATELAHARLGLSVSKKVGNAVVRNRWKRLIREAFRLAHHELPTSIDLVVRPRAGAEPVFDAIQQSLVELAKRLSKKTRRSTVDAPTSSRPPRRKRGAT